MSKHLLLTGATGLLGQYLLRDFLLQGRPTAVLIRASAGESAQQRMEQLMSRWDKELGRELPRPFCLEGDVSLPGCGLSTLERDWVTQNCDVVLHNAASLRLFGQARDQDPWLSNYTGTANILEVCRGAGLRELHYMSTAYVCGKRTGLVLESELDEGQDFHNDYERCKCEAEKMVRAADFLDRLTVYRPGIIVGDSQTGYTSTYHGLYLYLRWVWLNSEALPREADGRYHAPVRMHLRGDEACHIVPVDWVSAVTSYLLPRPECHGRTYHLTQQKPLTSLELEEALRDFFQYYGPTFADPDAGPLKREEWNEVEQSFYAMVAPYQQYWNVNLDFDTANRQAFAPHLPCPPIDRALLHRLVEFAIEDQWGRLRKKRGPRKPAAGAAKK
jgi:thioester reductase-like protein